MPGTLLVTKSSRKFYAIISSAVFVLAIYLWSGHPTFPPNDLDLHIGQRLTPREVAANATIGFSTIIALSTGPSWRSRGLKAAAEITGLDIKIPIQPPISDDTVQWFRKLGPQDSAVRKPSEGSARAWLAHLDLLKFVVASGFSTAMIVEDDVDFDVTLRTQMMLVSDNVRNFTGATEDDLTPYGKHWDVLWIGHCGEIPVDDADKLEYPDSSLMPTDLYAGWTKKYLVHIKEGHRAVQYLQQAVCTFGYAVTAFGARRILESLSSGQDEAFDVGLMNKCKQGALRCVTVNPEIMHHYNPKDGTGYVSQTMQGDGKGESSEETAFESLKGTTANMKNSARCQALFKETCPQPPTNTDS